MERCEQCSELLVAGDEITEVEGKYYHNTCWDERCEELCIATEDQFTGIERDTTIAEIITLFQNSQDFNEMFNIVYTYSFINDFLRSREVQEKIRKLVTLEDLSNIVTSINNYSVKPDKELYWIDIPNWEFYPADITLMTYNLDNESIADCFTYVNQVLCDNVWSKIKIHYTASSFYPFKVID